MSNTIHREFKLTTISLKNKNTIFLLTLIVAFIGLYSYVYMPKESYPEVKFKKIFIKSVYPGNSPIDMENLVTRPIEKEIQGVKGIKNINSNSSQDNVDIIVEFNSDVDINEALNEMKDAVDNASSDLPNDLPFDPIVSDIDVSEFPILAINLSGDFSLEELKNYAEYLQDKLEDIDEISSVPLKGINEREIKINVDPHKLDVFELSFNDIKNAVAYENMSISGGELVVDGTRRSIRTLGEFKTVSEISNIIIKNENNNIVYLRDVAQVIDGYEDPKSIARLDYDPVVSLQVIKKSGENILNASDKIFKVIEKARENNSLPPQMVINITNDQSDQIRKQVQNLENSIIMGVIFVSMVLFFFLGARNALLVGLAIPLSMMMSFLILEAIGATINMMILFGLILALGMLVDNAIVVVENINRFLHKGYNIFDACKEAVGEIAWPIIASTATTLAAFLPLAFWPGMMGEFMKFLPITLIIVLTSSLFVALIIIPVLARQFISLKSEDERPNKRRYYRSTGILGSIAILLYILGLNDFHLFLNESIVDKAVWFSIANLLTLFIIIGGLNLFLFFDVYLWFKNNLLIKLEEAYINILAFILKGKNSLITIGITFALLFITISIYFGSKPEVLLFPEHEPTFINVSATLPVGADISATDSVMNIIEGDIFSIIRENEGYEHLIKSVMTTIGEGAVGENAMAFGLTPEKGIITITFIDYEEREGLNTNNFMHKVSDLVVGKYPGIRVSVVKNAMGPPAGPPINIEIVGDNFDSLLQLTDKVYAYLQGANINGIEELNIDIDLGLPELIIHIDRDKARRFGLSTGQIGSAIRNSLFGEEISDFKVGEDEYPIQLQFNDRYRNDITAILDQRITFRNNMGKLMQIPISSVASFKNGTTFSSVKRKDLKRIITIYSNILEGYNPTRVNEQIKSIMSNYSMPEGYAFSFTGEQEEQAEASAFLMKAMFLAVVLIILILVTQFNSIIKPGIIIFSVLLSTIGVFGGLFTFNMDFVIIMTGMGIISLAGIVVNNAIVLVDYVDYLKLQKRKELGVIEDDFLPIKFVKECIIDGGKTRLRPVLLTAITTVLGLFPMALGMNINFGTLLSEFNPQIYFGGGNSDFWGPMAWTVIFGLVFATFLTLLVVPAMYYTLNKFQINTFGKKK